MNVVGIIPARYDSKRFPGKPLALICGKPMIEWVYKRALKCKKLNSLIVATDDQRILKTVESFGGLAEMTPKECQSGTDRIAYLAKNLDCDVVLNIQGDEPLIESEAIESLIGLFEEQKDLQMGTLITKMKSKKDVENPNCVKVIIDKYNFAIYFSRSPIPYVRDKKPSDFTFYKHIGIYAYKRDFLLKFSVLPQGKLEKAESLEQLRAIENGLKIKTSFVEKWIGVSVDRKEDILKVEEKIKKGGILPP